LTTNRRRADKSCAASWPLRVTEFHGTEVLEVPRGPRGSPLVRVGQDAGWTTRDLYWGRKGTVEVLRLGEGSDGDGRIMWLAGATWDVESGEWGVWYMELYEL
jgi:hypothetical protein